MSRRAAPKAKTTAAAGGRYPVRRLLGALTVVIAACGSPEATRTQGGGPGGDTGNRPEIVRMHEGSRPYHETPRIVPSETPALDTASQAREFGQR
jgi:hypothetical protein